MSDPSAEGGVSEGSALRGSPSSGEPANDRTSINASARASGGALVYRPGTKRLTDLASYGPIAVGAFLTIALTLTAQSPPLIAAWCLTELLLQGIVLSAVTKRWRGFEANIYIVRMGIAMTSLALMPTWAGPDCPSWLWALMSFPPNFVAWDLKKATICAVLLFFAAVVGQVLTGATLHDLIVPVVTLIAAVGSSAPFMAPLRQLVLKESSNAVKLRNFQRAFKHAGEAISISDANGKLLFVNPAWEEVTGISATYAMGRTPKELLRAPDADPVFFQNIADTIAQGRVWQGDIESETPQGKRLESYITVSPVLSAAGEVTHIVEVRSDIKERNRMVGELRSAWEAAEAANRAKSGFLANVSHEIRTPMNGVVGMASLLEDSELNGQQQEQVRTIRTSAEALLEIIQKVLDFASIEAGRLELFNAPLDLEALCRGVIAMIRVLPDAQGLDVRLDLDPELPRWIEGDVTRLRQVLTNLMANGAKFTSSGSVVLRLRQRGGGRVELAVIDTGLGISEEALTSIFKPFFQVDAGGAKRARGTGLGLAICNQIVQAMGSQIMVESELGEGTTFRFELDLVVARESQYEPAREMRSDVPIPRSDILVVEDDKVTQKLMPLLLNKLGHQATVVGNGREALAALEDKRYALIFMDCQMPVMDGLEATRRIRATHKDSNQLVLGLSADVQPEQIEASKAAGMDAIFAKPISLEQMREILATWLPADRP